MTLAGEAGGAMRKAMLSVVFLFFSTATGVYAQFGKYVPVPAGSLEGKALDEINATADAAQKLKLIDEFAADYGKGDMEILADETYVNYFLSVKNNDKAIEWGQKLWKLDPNNLQNGVNLVGAAQEKGDTALIFNLGEQAAAILQRYRAAPPPEGKDAVDWAREKEQAIEEQKNNFGYIAQVLIAAAYRSADPAARGDLLVRVANAFPDTTYAKQSLAGAAAAYQQAQQYPKMLELANGALAKDPGDVPMLLLLADYYSEKGEQADKAEANAAKAIALLDAAKKPEDVSDENWQKQVSLQKGLALTVLGQVNIQKNNNAAAVENLTTAGPLLKPDAVTYARNQYRLGFALLNLKRLPEARAALADAASVDSPYRPLAQNKLKSLPTGTGARKKP